ncbi:Potassium voltage-gated channel sub H member 7 [Rhizoclosmatium hyalinum]|nr:Potassium voltage-gated channel sub H member 7 [Rhizoclosmatium hyalinum]
MKPQREVNNHFATDPVLKEPPVPVPALPLPNQEAVAAQVQSWFLIMFQLPAYDSKGESVDFDQFDVNDVENITFRDNGLHPKSHFSTIWELFLTVSISRHSPDEVFFFSILITLAYSVDSLIFLVTPHPPSSTLNSMYTLREYETNRPLLPQWIKQRSSLVLIMIEIIPIIPFEIFFSSWEYGSLLFLIRLVRLWKLSKLTSRCALFTRFMASFSKAAGFSLSEIIPIGVGMIYFLHFNACSMYYFGKTNGFIGWHEVWAGFDDATVFEIYSFTFYKSVGNMFPMEFSAHTPTEQLVQSFYVVMSAVLYAVFIGAISSATMSINPSGRLYTQKMEELGDYVKWKNLTPETQVKIFSYYETKYRGKYFEEEALLMEMNESLRTEISVQNTRALLERVPFLRRQMNDGRDDIFFARLASACHAQYYVKNDYVTKQGDYGFDMYFILSGAVNVFVNGRKVVSLFDGAYFGEIALISKILRTATVQATGPSVLYRLTHTDFHNIISGFEDMKLRIAMLMMEHEQRLKNAETTEAAVAKMRKEQE